MKRRKKLPKVPTVILNWIRRASAEKLLALLLQVKHEASIRIEPTSTEQRLAKFAVESRLRDGA